jgi:general secretion pathway protein L
MMRTRLVLLSPSIVSPSSFLIVEDDARIADRGMLSADAPARPFKGRTVLVVPGAEIVTRWLELEAGRQARVVEAAADLLKDQISSPREDLHVALGEPEADGTRAVSVVDRALMQQFLDRADDFGVSPDVVIPDHLLLLPLADGLLAVTLNGIIAVRGERLAFTVESELATMLIGDRRHVSVERAAEIEGHFAAGLAHLSMNLLQQEFSRGGRGLAGWNGYRGVVTLGAIAALSPLALWTAELVRNEAAARGLEARAEAAARTIIGEPRAADPIGALRGRVAGLRANDGFMQTTAALFEAISQVQGVELEGLSYLQEGVIRATLVHSAGSDVGAVRGALEKSGITVDEDAAQERNGRLISTITLGRRS